MNLNDNYLIYISNFLCLFVLITLLVRHKSKTFVMPLAWICFSHFLFFSQPPQAQAKMVGLVHLITILGVLIGYTTYLFVRSGQSLLTHKDPIDLVVTDKPLVQITFLLACLTIQIAAPVTAIIQGVSPLQVLFGMRLKTGYANISAETALILTLLHRTPVIGVALGRLWCETTPRKDIWIVWWLLFISFIISGFASGGRTALGYPLMVMLAVDCYSLKILKIPQTAIKKILRRSTYILLICLIFFGMAYQSSFRTQRMRSSVEVKKAFMSLFLGEISSEKGIGGELSSGLNGAVAWVVKNYGKTIPFAYFYSLYAMAVNPFPRILWHSKPVGWGRRLAWEVLDQRPSNHGTSMAAGIGGEAYANGGFPTVVLFSLLFGVGFGWMTYCLFKPKSIVSAGFWLGALSWSLGLWRGDWLSNVNRLSYCLFGAWLIYRILRLFLGRDHTAQIKENRSEFHDTHKANYKKAIRVRS